MSLGQKESEGILEFISKSVKEIVGAKHKDLDLILNDISGKLSHLKTSKEEEGFKEYRDVLLEVSLKDFDLVTPTSSVLQIDSVIRRWVGALFDKLAKASFSGYFQGQLLEEEAKVFFSRNLIYNFVNFIECFQARTSQNWAQLSKQIIKSFQHHSKSALVFLMSKYPQKNNVQPDLVLSQTILQETEKYSNPVYDVIATSGFTFNYAENGDYASQIKTFLNILIQETKTKRSGFVTEMKAMFTTTKQSGDQMEEVENVVGSKLSETTKVFSEEEINNPGIDINNSQILRVLIKWIEYIYEDIKHVRSNTEQKIMGFVRKGKFLPKTQSPDSPPYVPVVDHGLSVNQKNQLMTSVESEFLNKIFEIGLDHNEKLNSVLSSLTKFISENRTTFQYIDIVQFKTSLFAHIVSESVSNLAVSFISNLIHILQRATRNVSKIDEDLKDISLLRFGVMDLLRAKCQGTRDQIIKVYNNIKKNPKFEIIRVKNRLKTGNKDFLINLKYKESFLICELQLYMKTKSDNDKKQSVLQHFSHFLYELERSRYGALSQAAIICANLYGPVSYFRQTLKDHTISSPHVLNICDLNPQYCNGTFKSSKFINTKNDYSFICHSCYRYFNAFSTFLDVLTHQDSRQNICGECILQMLGPEKSTQCILGDKLGHYFKEIPLDHKFKDQDYMVLVSKSFSRKLLALKYYNCYKFFSSVFLDHSPTKFYQFKDIKALTKNSYIFILDRQKITPLPQIKMQTLLNRQIKQTVPENIFLGEEGPPTDSEKDKEEKYVPIIPIGPAVNLVNKDQTIVCFSYQKSSILIIDSIGKINSIDQYLKSKRQGILQQYVKSKVDTWVGEELFITEDHLLEVLIKNPEIIIRRIRFPDNSFKEFKIELKVLEELNLRRNKFQKLDFDHIRLFSLEILDVSHNSITSVINTKSPFTPNLLSLNLSHNKIKEIHLQIGSFRKLQRLILSWNPIQTIILETGFQFQQLIYLEIQQTPIKTLDFSTIKFPQLKNLMLRNNSSLTSIYLPILEKIQEIDVSRCKTLSDINFSRYMVRSLKSLNLSKCRFDKFAIPVEFPDLQSLNLSSNYLVELDLSKMHLTSLKQLDASNNKIKTVSLCRHSKQLQKLILKKNYIQRLDTQSNFPKLIEINLQQNSLTEFELSGTPELKRLMIKLNPGQCQSLLKVDSTQLPLLEFLTVGVNPSTKNYVQWIYMNLSDQTKLRFRRRVLKTKKQNMKKRLKQLLSNSLPESFKELKYFLRVIDKMNLHSEAVCNPNDLVKLVTRLFRSANPNSNFVQFSIHPVLNVLNVEYNNNHGVGMMHGSLKNMSNEYFHNPNPNSNPNQPDYSDRYQQYSGPYGQNQRGSFQQNKDVTSPVQAYIPINISPYIINPVYYPPPATGINYSQFGPHPQYTNLQNLQIPNYPHQYTGTPRPLSTQSPVYPMRSGTPVNNLPQNIYPQQVRPVVPLRSIPSMQYTETPFAKPVRPDSIRQTPTSDNLDRNYRPNS